MPLAEHRRPANARAPLDVLQAYAHRRDVRAIWARSSAAIVPAPPVPSSPAGAGIPFQRQVPPAGRTRHAVDARPARHSPPPRRSRRIEHRGATNTRYPPPADRKVGPGERDAAANASPTNETTARRRPRQAARSSLFSWPLAAACAACATRPARSPFVPHRAVGVSRPPHRSGRPARRRFAARQHPRNRRTRRSAPGPCLNTPPDGVTASQRGGVSRVHLTPSSTR